MRLKNIHNVTQRSSVLHRIAFWVAACQLVYFFATQIVFTSFCLAFGGVVIRCHLSRFMGERKLKVVDLARETNLNRSTISALYHETAARVELEAVEKLCRFFGCDVGDMFELADDE